MTKKQSNQRITKIKRDTIEELLKKAEAVNVEDAVSVQPASDYLTAYPDMNKLRIWARENLLKGINKVYPVDITADGQTNLTTILDGLVMSTKMTKSIEAEIPEQDFNQPTLDSNGTLGGTTFAVSATSSKSGYDAYNVTNKTKVSCWQSDAGELPQSLILYTPQAVQLNQLIFNNNFDSELTGSLLKGFKLYGSNDNETYTELGTYNNTYTTIGTTEYSFNVATSNTYKYFKIEVNSIQTPAVEEEFTPSVYSFYGSMTYDDDSWTTASFSSTAYVARNFNNPYTTTTAVNSMSYTVTFKISSLPYDGYISYIACIPACVELFILGSTQKPRFLLYKTSGTRTIDVPMDIELNTVYTLKIDVTEGVNVSVKLKQSDSSYDEVATTTLDTSLAMYYSTTIAKYYKYLFIGRYSWTAPSCNLEGSVKLEDIEFIVDGVTLIPRAVNIVKIGDDNCVIGYVGLSGIIPAQQIAAETSKPGLWLSNLSQPISSSLAGGWLRHNLINNNSSYFDSVNSDTIGNYSYSFLQRGIFKRVAGSAHDDNDSYCQHWSPSALGCISHDAIVIPLMNLRTTYTSYQTLVTPSNPDMQSYTEALTKDVEYTFVDNDNNIPLTTTQFNGRVVGADWKFEGVVSGNHAGSASDYGKTPTTGSNSSNGVCLNGTFTWIASSGDSCVEAVVDFCRQTFDASLNSDNPNRTPADISTNIQGNAASYAIADFTIPMQNYAAPCIYAGTFNAYDCSGNLIYSQYYSNSSAPQAYLSNNVTGLTWYDTGLPVDLTDYDGISMNVSGLKGYVYNSHSFPGASASSNCYAVSADASYISNYSPLTWFFSNNSGFNPYIITYATTAKTGSCSYVTCKAANVKAWKKGTSPKTGVNIYLNITDLKAQYEAYGLPWNYNCSDRTRFQYDFSTEACTSVGCSSTLIYSNVTIDTNGDFVEDLPEISV